jgi:predicted amidophosphoribosyltransferase
MFVLNRIPAGVSHLLVIDDVVTTGATVTACAKQIAQNGGIKISVLALGCTKR